MRFYLLATAMLTTPGIASAQPQCAVGKATEPLIQIPAPVDVTGRPVLLAPPRRAATQDKTVPKPIDHLPPLSPAVVDRSPGAVPPERSQLGDLPILRHVADAGARLVDLGTSHGLRTVAAQHGGEFMIFQVVPDGQVAVAGLMTDLTLTS